MLENSRQGAKAARTERTKKRNPVQTELPRHQERPA
jgi:hypothetical protein